MEVAQMNYYHVVKDSQFYTDLDMVIRSLEYLRHQVSDEIPKPIEANGYTSITLESPRAKLDYILKGLENTKKNGYKLTNDSE